MKRQDEYRVGFDWQRNLIQYRGADLSKALEVLTDAACQIRDGLHRTATLHGPVRTAWPAPAGENVTNQTIVVIDYTKRGPRVRLNGPQDNRGSGPGANGEVVHFTVRTEPLDWEAIAKWKATAAWKRTA